MTKRAILDIGACLRLDGSQTLFNPISVGGGKPFLSKALRDFVEMTALWEVWKTLPTFPHFPQCLGKAYGFPTFPQSRRRLLDIDFRSKS